MSGLAQEGREWFARPLHPELQFQKTRAFLVSSQKNTSSTVPGRGEAAASFATWDPAPPKDAVSGRVGLPVQVDFAVLACEALGGPQPVHNSSMYKSAEMVFDPRTTLEKCKILQNLPKIIKNFAKF